MSLLADDPHPRADRRLRPRRPRLRGPAGRADHRARSGRARDAAASIALRRGAEGHLRRRRRVRDPQPALRVGARAARGDRLGDARDPHARARASTTFSPAAPACRWSRRRTRERRQTRSAAGDRATAARASSRRARGCARSTRSTATWRGWSRSTRTWSARIHASAPLALTQLAPRRGTQQSSPGGLSERACDVGGHPV